MDFVHEYCAVEQQKIDIMIALQEGLANAVLHGSGNDPSKIIRCAVDITPEAITIVISDPGQGFDTAAATDSADDGTNLTQHGRGIHLMRGLMDEVSYRHGGSELHLKKLRTPQS
jgi:serine/threonine-protein kinase RsbW